MRILLINNHSLLNAGDHAILLETLRLLHAGIPGAQIELVFNDTASARTALPGYAIYAAPLTWAAPLQADGNYRFKPMWQRRLYMVVLLLAGLCYRLTRTLPPLFADAQKRALLRAFARADMVLACGGGYIYSPGPGDGFSGWFGFMLSGCALAILMGKPLALLPQSIGPLQDRFQREATRWVARHAHLVCVRERQSLLVLRELGADARALQLPDVAFGADPTASGAARAVLQQASSTIFAAPLRVGMTVLNWHGQALTFQGQQAYEAAMLGCIDAITAQEGLVVLFAQCGGPSAAEDDRVVSRQLHDRARQPERVIVLETVLPPDALQAAYGLMHFFIGTRMHSVILALNAGTPALAIGYLHKTRGVLEELGLSDYCLDIGTISAEQLVAAFERLRAALAQPEVAPYLAQARRYKRALAQVLRTMGST